MEHVSLLLLADLLCFRTRKRLYDARKAFSFHSIDGLPRMIRLTNTRFPYFTIILAKTAVHFK